MPTALTKVLDQIRELNLLLIRSKLQIERNAQQSNDSPARVAATRATAARSIGERTNGGNQPAQIAAPANAARNDSPTEQTAQTSPATQAAVSDVSAFRGQGRMLAILGLKPVISQKDLSYMLGMSRQAMGELLNRLEHKGYIKRDPSTADKRMVTIRLTEAGKLAAHQVRQAHHEVGADLLDCLSETELTQFSGYLKRIIDNAEEKLADDEFAERRKAMKEFLSLPQQAMHRNSAAQDIAADGEVAAALEDPTLSETVSHEERLA